MATSSSQNVVERIHASGKRLVLSITGGGSGAIAELLKIPGASATMLEAVVPYSAAALERWLGGRPDQYCSERTARAMAMAAFVRARELTDAEPYSLRGIGATASLATTRPKRGLHRVHVAWQSAEMTAALTCELSKGERTRSDEEVVATQLILEAVAEACSVPGQAALDSSSCGRFNHRVQPAPAAWTKLLLGEISLLDSGDEQRGASSPPAVVFPGAFNPLHPGHERIAELAAQRYGTPVAFELSIANVDKPPLDFIEIADRLEWLAGRRVLLTRAPTFAEKATLAPGCVFVAGADTLQRIGDPKYYDGDPAKRDAAIAAIADHGCRFLVFGRMVAGKFSSLRELDLPKPLRALCDEVPESEFRDDITSTELRDE